MGCDGFHPTVLLDLTEETRGEIVEFLEKVEQSGKWPQQACTTMFFLIPKNVTSERPIALMPTLIRWWEALRWRSGSRSIAWTGRHAADGRNGGAQQTVWEILLEMERFDGKAKGKDQGALALVPVWALATHFSFPRKILRVLCFVGISSTGGECSSEGVRRNRSRPSRPSCQGPSGFVCFYVLCCKMR